MNRNPGGAFLLACSTMFMAYAPAYGQNSDGYWNRHGGGSWANAANWDGGTIADGTDNTAYFGFPFEAGVPANATFTLDGARSIGNLFFTTTNQGPDNWILAAGSGGPLTLDDDIDYPEMTVSLANQQVTVSVVLAGTAGLEKLGPGTLVLTATNTYSGGTIISGGTLAVDGVITDGVGLTNLSGTLMGAGIIAGPVAVQSGADFAPGNSGIGTLTISNSLTLQAGSQTTMEVNAATSAHDLVLCLSNIVYGGTLAISNVAGTPTLGQSFQLFSASGATGDFSGLTPQLVGGMRWRFDPVRGLLFVVQSASQPRIASVTSGGTNVILQIINGAPAVTNYLLASTNLLQPLATWTRLGTNVFDLSGTCAFTNSLNANSLSPRFYSVSISLPF